MIKPKVSFNINPKKTIYILLYLILVLFVIILMQQANLYEQRKQTIATSGFCIKNTADVTANYQLALIREQDARKRDIDKANQNIELIVNEYNNLLAKVKRSGGFQNTSPKNIYSYRVYPTLP